MRHILGPVLLIAGLPSASLAGEIYGNIQEGGKLIGGGVKVEVQCPSASAETQTKSDGSYRLYVHDVGKCMLTVDVHGGLSIPIQSYNSSVRYNLVVERQADGTYVLRRR